MENDPTEELFQLGEWLVEPSLNRIRRQDLEIRLEPKVMALLLKLSAASGRPISRQELLDSVWSDAVVGGEALTMAISKLRKALGDSSAAPRYIETIAKSGYRLIQHAEPVDRKATVPDVQPATMWGRVSRPILGLMSLLGLALLSIWPMRFASTPSSVELLGDTRLTSQPGGESQAQVSPDGTRVVFVRNGAREPTPGVYLLEGEGMPRKLVEGHSTAPVWSPNGSRIAYTACAETGCEIRIVSSKGGPWRTVTRFLPCPLVGIDWSPDGRWIAISAKNADLGTYAIFEVDVETGRERRVTSPPAGSFDSRPRYSPSGESIAFSRGLDVFRQDVFIKPTAGDGPAQAVTAEQRRIWGFDWASDGESIVFSSNRRGPYQLWRVPIAGGEPSWIPVAAENVRFPSITGSQLVFEAHDIGAEIWLSDEGGSRLYSKLQSNRRDASPRHSPDGRRLAFVSTRSGFTEVWLTSEDSEPRALTSLEAVSMTRPEWSADGRYLAVTALVEEKLSIYMIDTGTGGARQLEGLEAFAQVGHPSWSADGKSIYFAAEQEGQSDLWRSAASGGQLTKVVAGGQFGLESSDGHELYFVLADSPAIWRRPVAGGPALKVVSEQHGPLSWLLTDEGLYFLRGSKIGWELVFSEHQTGAQRVVAELPEELLRSGLSVSPEDGKVLFSRYRRYQSDLRLITDFS